MKTFAGMLLCIGLLGALEAQAQAPQRRFNQAELDALLAPVALYPDALLQQILAASTRPYDVEQAARWPRGSPPPRQSWHPAVEALLHYPDVLARMGENPQWVRDLGDAWMGNERWILDTVQLLRLRAEATGNLRSDDQQQVRRQGETIVVQPVYPQQLVYVPYYNPLVVFGNWWWTSYRPVVWRPWHARPVHVHHTVHVHRPIHVNHPPHRPHVNHPPHRPVQVHSAPAPIVNRPHAAPRPHAAVPQVQRHPGVQHHPVARPAAISQVLRQNRSISR